MSRSVRGWLGVVSALAAAALAVGVVELAPWPRRDFPAFAMTVEERNPRRIGLADGRTIGGTSVYRIEYRSRNDWTIVLVSDEAPGAPELMIPGQGSFCRDGAFGHIDIHGVYRVTSRDPLDCTTLDRWIHYGIAWAYPWKKEIAEGVITYTDPGERVAFDAKTGLPLVYEAGLNNPVGPYRRTYHVERWGN